MIEEGFFSHFLKPLIKKKNEKDVLESELKKYIKTPFTFTSNGLEIRIQNISTVQKKELFLYKDEIEKDLEGLLSKKYIILF